MSFEEEAQEIMDIANNGDTVKVKKRKISGYLNKMCNEFHKWASEA